MTCSNAGRPLRTIVYVRFSSEKQESSDLTDQVCGCRRYLAVFGVRQVHRRNGSLTTGEANRKCSHPLTGKGVQP